MYYHVNLSLYIVEIKKNEFSLINETHHDPDIHSYSYMNVLTPQNTAPALLTTENNGVWLTSSTIMTGTILYMYVQSILIFIKSAKTALNFLVLVLGYN